MNPHIARCFSFARSVMGLLLGRAGAVCALWLVGWSAPAQADSVFVCSNARANTFASCNWPTQWAVKAPAQVVAGDRVLTCARGSVGVQDVSRCTGSQWTTLAQIADAGLVGVCGNVAGGGNVLACDIASGGTEGFKTKATVFGTTTPQPTLSLVASPTTVASGTGTTLTWTATNVTACTATGGWSGARATAGSEAIGALTASTTFGLNCTNGSGAGASASVVVTVVPPKPPAPTLTFTAAPSSVTSGGASTLSWSTANATSCTASGGWSGARAVSGSQSTGTLSSSQTYGLTCVGAGGSVAASATVTVTPVTTTAWSGAVFVCTNGSASSFGSCLWSSQWVLKSATAVTATDRILYCPNGSVGKADVSACPNVQWTVVGSIPAAGLVGICTGAAAGSAPSSCSISSGGGEGWQTRATVFGGGTGSTPPTTLSFQRSVVDTASPYNPWMKAMADLDGDGLPDLIVSGANGPVVWYQAPNWTKRTIATTASSESGSAVGDINGDGSIDVVIGKTWYENVGKGSSWIAHPLPAGTAGTHDIVIADINGDGKSDIIMRGETASVVTVYLQVTKDSWTVFGVEPGVGLNGLDVADLNADGYPDIVVGGVWMENPRSAQATTAWAKRVFASSWDPYASVKVIDIDRDGRADVVLGVSESVGRLSWFKAPADPRTGPWVENVVASGLDHAHGVSVFDVDRNGTLDIVVSEYAGLGRLLVYQGNGGTSWTATELGRDSLHNLQAADLDGDGDIDFFGVNAWGNPPVIVYRNTMSMPNRVLVYSRTLGFRHASIPDGIAAIQSLGAANGFAVDATEDPTTFNSANLARYKALIFLNPSGDILDATQRAAFQLYMRNGGGWVGIHNPNALTLDGWDWYTGLVCARYATEIAAQPSRLTVVDATHLSTIGLPAAWSASFESYNWDVNPKTRGAKVLINLDETSVTGGTMGADHPFSWYHAYDGGRAWYTVGGADSANFVDATFMKHILGGIRYAGGF